MSLSKLRKLKMISLAFKSTNKDPQVQGCEHSTRNHKISSTAVAKWQTTSEWKKRGKKYYIHEMQFSSWIWMISKLYPKGCLSLFHHSIDMRTAVNLSISCRKNVLLLKLSEKNTFFLHEMDKLTAVLMSMKWWNKERQPLVE